MPEHLSLTRDEYEAVAEAARAVSAGCSYGAYRQGLADALRGASPALADMVGRLNDAQTRALREAVERAGRAAAPDHLSLTFAEWQVLARSASLVRLLGDRLTSTSLVEMTAGESPALAEKLSDLSAARLARLFFALLSGRRFCQV
jgi:hypothetical protein